MLSSMRMDSQRLNFRKLILKDSLVLYRMRRRGNPAHGEFLKEWDGYGITGGIASETKKRTRVRVREEGEEDDIIEYQADPTPYGETDSSGGVSEWSADHGLHEEDVIDEEERDSVDIPDKEIENDIRR